MLETIREFAGERLDALTEKQTIERRHAENLPLAIAERAAEELLGAGQKAWLDRLDLESGNFRSALGWAIDRGDVVVASRLGAALWRFWRASAVILLKAVNGSIAFLRCRPLRTE